MKYFKEKAVGENLEIFHEKLLVEIAKLYENIEKKCLENYKKQCSDVINKEKQDIESKFKKGEYLEAEI